jgi:predicted transcriptional regulator
MQETLDHQHDRSKTIVDLLNRGMKATEIAKRLGVTGPTVSYYIKSAKLTNHSTQEELQRREQERQERKSMKVVASPHGVQFIFLTQHAFLDWTELNRALIYVESFAQSSSEVVLDIGEYRLSCQQNRIWLQVDEQRYEITSLWPTIRHIMQEQLESGMERVNDSMPNDPVVLQCGDFIVSSYPNGLTHIIEGDSVLLSLTKEQIEDITINIERAKAFDVDYFKLFGNRVLKYSNGRVTLEAVPIGIDSAWKAISGLYTLETDDDRVTFYRSHSRKQRVYALYQRGCSQTEIARRMDITPASVNYHVKKLRAEGLI